MLHLGSNSAYPQAQAGQGRDSSTRTAALIARGGMRPTRALRYFFASRASIEAFIRSRAALRPSSLMPSSPPGLEEQVTGVVSVGLSDSALTLGNPPLSRGVPRSPRSRREGRGKLTR